MSSLIYPALWHFISLQGEGGGTVVYNLEATDEDEGNNKKLTYAITAGNNGEFILNSNTGVLQISPTGLDRELHSNYNLTINVTDAGNPVLWVGTKGCRPSSLIICDLRLFIYFCNSPLWNCPLWFLWHLRIDYTVSHFIFVSTRKGIENATLSFRISPPSTLNCHENRAFRKRRLCVFT